MKTADFADSASKFVSAVRSGNSQEIFRSGADWINNTVGATSSM